MEIINTQRFIDFGDALSANARLIQDHIGITADTDALIEAYDGCNHELYSHAFSSYDQFARVMNKKNEQVRNALDRLRTEYLNDTEIQEWLDIFKDGYAVWWKVAENMGMFNMASSII